MPARSWKFHSSRLLLASVVVLLLGWWSGHPFIAGLVALLLYVTWNMVNIWRLYHWLQNSEGHIPESHGVWSDIFDRINTLDRQNQRQKEQYRKMIGEFQSLTDAFPDATLVIDENDNITWFNNAAITLLGLKIPEDLGQTVTNLLREPDFADWLAVQGEVKSSLEMPSPRDNSTWLNVSAVSFRENQRLLILRNISDVHNLEQVRRDFVANISHELRTPLTVLLGYLELLGQDSPDNITSVVERMQTQAQQMQAMLNDLLELSRLQSREVNSEEQEINVPGMLMQLKEQAEEISGQKHELVFDLQDGLNLVGIPSDLESAFRNLIVNAVKYTPEDGKITVAWSDEPGGPTLIVEDTGIGIPSRAIPRLTERFYRVSSDRARHTGGTGLGLSIVKHVLNAHQARLVISSELGEGSQFRCIFPPGRRAGAEPATAASQI